MQKSIYKVAFCANTKERTMDELILDLFEKNYEYNGNLDRRDLWERHGGKGREFQIEFAELQKLFSVVKETFHRGEFYFENKDYEVRQEEKRQRKMRQKRRELVPKDRLWRAIKWECCEEELNELCSFEKYRYERGDYYDFDLFLERIHAFMVGERSVGYFTSWLIVLMRCLQEGLICNDRRQKEIYDDIADMFDGAAFMSSDISEQQKRIYCLELIALLKDFDHQLKNIETKSDDPHAKNGVITYVSFYTCIENDGELMNVCVVDENRRKINFLYVQNLVYEEEINYTFLTQAEFARLSGIYFGYSFDATMKADHALMKENN